MRHFLNLSRDVTFVEFFMKINLFMKIIIAAYHWVQVCKQTEERDSYKGQAKEVSIQQNQKVHFLKPTALNGVVLKTLFISIQIDPSPTKMLICHS